MCRARKRPVKFYCHEKTIFWQYSDKMPKKSPDYFLLPLVLFCCDSLKLEFLGGAREVGRSCIRVGIGKVSLLMDAGVKTENRVVRFPTPRPVSADAVIVSHCHLDHIGYLPVFFSRNEKKTPYFCTPPTEPLIEMLLEDSLRVFSNKGMEPYYSVRDMRMLPRYAHTMAYQRPYEFFDGTLVAFFDAGHVLGSAQVLLSPPKGEGKPLLYSGDVNPEPSQM